MLACGRRFACLEGEGGAEEHNGKGRKNPTRQGVVEFDEETLGKELMGELSAPYKESWPGTEAEHELWEALRRKKMHPNARVELNPHGRQAPPSGRVHVGPGPHTY